MALVELLTYGLQMTLLDSSIESLQENVQTYCISDGIARQLGLRINILKRQRQRYIWTRRLKPTE